MSSLKEQNGKYYEQCKVVMVSTNDKSPLGFTHTYQRLTLNSNNTLSQYKHLYILSDEEIQEGDWCIANYYNEDFYLVQAKNIALGNVEHGQQLMFPFNSMTHEVRFCKKIIATTDTSLGLPQPSQSFINRYIEEYNKGSVIEDVLVEYSNEWAGKRYIDDMDAYGYDKFELQLKVDSDNTITIKKIKDSYSREELDNILNEVLNLGMTVRQNQLSGHEERSGNEILEMWKQENL